MKCQKCNNEAVFFSRENINGNVTEKTLCRDCAEKEGYLRDGYVFADRVFENGFFEGFETMLGGLRRYPARFFGGFPLMYTLSGGRQQAAPGQGQPIQMSARPASAEPAQIDEEINKRRELNVLRERMRTAAANEDFEKAARLRDEIRALEGGN